MFNKPTLADIIKRDLATALHEAHEHSKAAEHHDALMMMFTDRAQRLQERLDTMGSPPLVSRAITSAEAAALGLTP